MPTHFDFEGLAAYLLGRARDFLPRWLPGGRLQGSEFVCGSLQGGAPGENGVANDSCKVNIQTGKWSDFATMEKGGDLISLFAAIKGLKQGEAAKLLSEEANYTLVPDKAQAPARPKKEVEVLKIPPEGTAAPNFGSSTGVWCYRSDLGHPLFYIARYDTVKEGHSVKSIIPFTWEGSKWVNKHPPAPRPLFNLNLLRDFPKLPVLVVEGEKCAIAAMQIVGDRYVVTTWPGGANSDHKAAWKPLYGREVVLWPDADSRHRYGRNHASHPEEVMPYAEQPGPAAMRRVAALLAGHCPEVKIINVEELYKKDMDGWDAADALAEGWGWDEFLNWARPKLEIFKPPLPAPAGAENLVNFPGAPGGGSKPGLPTLSITEDVGPLPGTTAALYQVAKVIVMNNGNPVCNLDNVLRVMQTLKEPEVWFDEFHQRVFTTWGGPKREWSDTDTLNLMLRFQRDFAFRKITDDIIFKSLQVFAHGDTRNEPKDWLTSLEWDRTERCYAFFTDYMKASPDLYTKAASQNFWISMVARILEPGCKVDNMVVLQGVEGVRKSTALNVIGGDWYTEMMIDLNNLSGFLEVLPGKLLVEISEMDAFKKADATTIKKVITNKVDRYRPPYGRLAADFKRQCIFVGTTNEQEFLRDMTGNRRFWPVPVGMIDTDLIARDRAQLFAEALHLYKNKATWHLMPEEATRQMQESRREKDLWEDIIAGDLVHVNQTSMAHIAKEILGLMVQKLDSNQSKRIGRIMTKLGWVSKSERSNETGLVQRVWVRVHQANLLGE